MLTTIDLPVVFHVTRASAGAAFLGMMLTLDVRAVVQVSSEMDLPRPHWDEPYRAISFEALEAGLLDPLVRLVSLLGESVAVQPRVQPLVRCAARRQLDLTGESS